MPTFFYNNCCKNGILPVVLPLEASERLLDIISNPEDAEITVDLPNQQVRAGDETFDFDIDPLRKADLLAGTDDIARSLLHIDAISDYEAAATLPAPHVTQEALDFLAMPLDD